MVKFSCLRSGLLAGLFFFIAAGCGRLRVMTYGYNNSVGTYYDIRGIRMYTEVYGKGKPLLMIHGNGGDMSAFANNIPYFSKKYKELDHIDFSNLDLTNASFKGMIVTECKFDDARLDGANFENAEFDNCSFRDTEDGRFLYPKNVNARNSRFYMGSIGLDGGERKGMKVVPGLRRKETPKDFFDRSSWCD